MFNEIGFIIPQGIGKLRKQLSLILEDADNNLTGIACEVFAEQYEIAVIKSKVNVKFIIVKYSLKAQVLFW